MRAIVIDDSRAVRRILSGLLRELGFEPSEAGDGAQALLTLGELGPIDLALVDWNMPVLSGIDFVRVVRQNQRYASMRIVMVTTESDIEHVQTALTAGADEFVMKPFTKDVLLEKLALLGLGGS